MSNELMSDEVRREIERANLRRKGIGGTDAAAILGLSPWRSPHNVWLEKMGLAVREETEAMYWGKVLEPIVLDEYAKREGARLTRLTFPDSIVRKTGREWMIASVDALRADQPVGVDAKTTDPHNAWRWGEPGTDEIPEWDLLQMQWYMAVLPDHERWDVAVLMGKTFRIYRVRPNNDLQQAAVEICGEWWERYVLGQTPPPADGSEGARRMVERLFPRDLAEVKPADERAARLAFLYREVDRRADELYRQRDLLRNQLCAIIGDDAGIAGDFGRITWKRTKDGKATDWKAVLDGLASYQAVQDLRTIDGRPVVAALVEKHTTPKPGVRRFLPQFDEKALPEPGRENEEEVRP